MNQVLRDPTGEVAEVNRVRFRPPETLTDKTIALMDIGKMRGSEFIDRLEQLLHMRGLHTRRYRKPTNTRTAPIELIQEIASEADVVVIALSDCGSCTSCSTHDLNELDKLGVAGVSILTEEFRHAFEQQCSKIGFRGASVYTPHPMQNKTTEQLRDFADAVVEQVLAALVIDAMACPQLSEASSQSGTVPFFANRETPD